MFKYTKRLIAEIRFQLDELKWDKKEQGGDLPCGRLFQTWQHGRLPHP